MPYAPSMMEQRVPRSFNNKGKSLSEAFIFASTNPQYAEIWFIELQVQYVKIPSSNLGRTGCVQKLFLTFRTIFVHNMFSPCSVKRRASDKDLPVQKTQRIILPSQISESVKVVEATGSSHLPLPAHLSHLAQPRKVHEIRLNIKNLYFTEIRALIKNQLKG